MRKLLKTSSIYSFGGMLNSGVQFLLLPLYTRILHPADYGKLELVYLVGGILTQIFGFAIQTGYTRIFFKYKDETERKKLFSTSQLFILITSAIFGIMIFAFSEPISKLFFGFEESVEFLKLICIITLIKNLSSVPYSYLRNHDKAKIFIAVNLIALITSIMLKVYFVAFTSLGVKGVLFAIIIGNIIEIVILMIITNNQMNLYLSILHLKQMLNFSFFLLLPNLSAIIFNYGNRYFLRQYQNLEEVGLFSLGNKFAMFIPLLFIEPVKKAFVPYLFSIADNVALCKKTLKDFSRLYFGGLSIVVISISMFASDLIYIMADADYAGSGNVVFILSLSKLLLGLSSIIVLGIHVTNKTWIVAVIWPISAAINTLFNILFIPKFGRMGAAYASLLSMSIIIVLTFIALLKVYYINFDYSKYIIIVGLMTFFMFLAKFVQEASFANLLIKFILIIGYIFSLFLFRVFNKKEIGFIISLKNRIIK